MNVSELSDVELNRAMIRWRYGDGDKDIERLYSAGKLNFLTDYNLTMPLAKLHMLTISSYKNITYACDFIWDFESKNKNPLRAICEVLIMIAMEKKG